MKRECETCIKRKTPYCPTSIDCMATDDMPYYQNRIMLLEENKKLKKRLDDCKNRYKKHLNNQLSEGIEPDVEDFYLAEIEGKANDYNKTIAQQKEFIEYLSGYIEMLSPPYSNNNEDIVKITKSILSKYKEINHIPDNGKMVGGKE